MKKTKRASAKKTVKSKKGLMAMKVRYSVSGIVIICAIILGALTMMGPKLGLQIPPIEPKAMAHLSKAHMLTADEKLQGYKATSYYSYTSGIVVTDKRIFVYENNKQTSIPLGKITMVVIKDTELGHQEVLLGAQATGMIAFEMYHTDVPKLIDMLHVPASIIKHYDGSNKMVSHETATGAMPAVKANKPQQPKPGKI